MTKESLRSDEILDVLLENELVEVTKLELLYPHLIRKFNGSRWYQKLLFVMRFKEADDCFYDCTTIPKKYRTVDVYMNCVNENPFAILTIPHDELTEEVCESAVKQFGEILEYLPLSMRTEKVCLAAVSQNGYALKYVPKEMKTEEMCNIAVANNGWALTCVPEHFRRRR